MRSVYSAAALVYADSNPYSVLPAISMYLGAYRLRWCSRLLRRCNNQPSIISQDDIATQYRPLSGACLATPARAHLTRRVRKSSDIPVVIGTYNARSYISSTPIVYSYMVLLWDYTAVQRTAAIYASAVSYWCGDFHRFTIRLHARDRA